MKLTTQEVNSLAIWATLFAVVFVGIFSYVSNQPIKPGTAASLAPIQSHITWAMILTMGLFSSIIAPAYYGIKSWK